MKNKIIKEEINEDSFSYSFLSDINLKELRYKTPYGYEIIIKKENNKYYIYKPESFNKIKHTPLFGEKSSI